MNKVNYSDYELACYVVERYNKNENGIDGKTWLMWNVWVGQLSTEITENQRDKFFPDISYMKLTHKELADYYVKIALTVKLGYEVKEKKYGNFG